MKLSPLQLNPALLSASAGAQPTVAKDAKMEKIEAAARDFEAMFMAEMMKPMFESVDVDETFGGGKGEEIFRGFLREEYGKQIADIGSLGIADLVKEELIAMQSKANQPAMAQNMQEKS